MLLDLGFSYEENAEYNFSHKYWSCFHEQVDDNTDEWFAEYLVDIKNAIAKGEKELQKKSDSEKKARMKHFSLDKEQLLNHIDSIETSFIPVLDNEESTVFFNKMNNSLKEFKSEWISKLEKL